MRKKLQTARAHLSLLSQAYLARGAPWQPFSRLAPPFCLFCSLLDGEALVCFDCGFVRTQAGEQFGGGVVGEAR